MAAAAAAARAHALRYFLLLRHARVRARALSLSLSVTPAAHGVTLLMSSLRNDDDDDTTATASTGAPSRIVRFHSIGRLVHTTTTRVPCPFRSRDHAPQAALRPTSKCALPVPTTHRAGGAARRARAERIRHRLDVRTHATQRRRAPRSVACRRASRAAAFYIGAARAERAATARDKLETERRQCSCGCRELAGGTPASGGRRGLLALGTRWARGSPPLRSAGRRPRLRWSCRSLAASAQRWSWSTCC